MLRTTYQLLNFVLFFRLTNDIRHDIFKLIAIDLDSHREQQEFESESFCEIIEKIQSEKCKVYYINISAN